MDKSPQAVFDKVVAHLRQQGEQSLGPDGACMYRGTEGRMCAVGCLIPDSEYSEGMEGRPVDALKLFRDWSGDVISLLGRLQNAHDRCLGVLPEARWEDRFRSIAADFGLVYTAPAP